MGIPIPAIIWQGGDDFIDFNYYPEERLVSVWDRRILLAIGYGIKSCVIKLLKWGSSQHISTLS